MKEKLFSKKIAVIMAIAAAFAAGMFGGTAVAAGSYQVFAPRSYGTFTYDDGNALNNNGHTHDFMIDTSDLKNIAENVDALANITDKLNNSIMSFPEFIYDESGKIIGYKTETGADTVFPFSMQHSIQANAGHLNDGENGAMIYVSLVIDGVQVSYREGSISAGVVSVGAAIK